MNDKKQSNMESKGKNIPKLRFPGFEGEWEVKKLGEISSVFQGYGFPEKYQGKTNGDIPFYKVSDISFSTDKGNKYILDAKNYIDKETLPLLHAKLIPIGSTIFAKIGEAIRKNNRAITKVPCLIDNNAAAIKAIENISLDEFLFYTMSQIELINYAGGVVPAVTKTAIESIQVPFPTLPEQQKIASCLSSLDGQISAEQSRLESLSQHKRGLMQQLFPQEGETVPKLRFPGFEGEWEVEKIHDLFEIRNGYTPSKATPEYWENGTIPWFRMEDIRENGNILYDSMQHISKSAIKGNKLFKANSIIVATSATIGEHALIKVDSMANQRFTNLAIKENYAQLLDTMYIYHYMFIVDEICKKNTNMNAFASVDMKTFGNIPFSFPALPEQQKIASCLTAIDKLIAAQQERIEALKQHKRGLMQQLFPAVANE